MEQQLPTPTLQEESIPMYGGFTFCQAMLQDTYTYYMFIPHEQPRK